MQVIFTKNGFSDLSFWINTDSKIAKKIISLIEDIKRNPFSGKGKPEPLKHEYTGFWSRRINREHRLIYAIESNEKDQLLCTIIQCRYHY